MEADKLAASSGSLASNLSGLTGEPTSLASEENARRWLAHIEENVRIAQEADAAIAELMRARVGDELGLIRLADDSIAAEMRAKLEAPALLASAHDRKIETLVNQSLGSILDTVFPAALAAGISPDYPNWERSLYQSFPPAQALQLANYIRGVEGATETDRAQMAATAFLENPQQQPGGTDIRDPDKLPVPPIRLPEPPNVPQQPGDPVPTTHTLPQPAPPTCHAYGECGTCRMPDGSLGRLGRVPEILDYHVGANFVFPTDEQILNCRLVGAKSMSWIIGSNQWRCNEPGTNYCDEPAPPTPLPAPAGSTSAECPPQQFQPTTVCAPAVVDTQTGQMYVPPGSQGGSGGAGGAGGPAGNVQISVPVTVNVPADEPPPTFVEQAPPNISPVTVPCYRLDSPQTVCMELATTGVAVSLGTVTDGTFNPLPASGGSTWGAIINAPFALGEAMMGVWNYLFQSDSDAAKAEGQKLIASAKLMDQLVTGKNEDCQCPWFATYRIAAKIGATEYAGRNLGIPTNWLTADLNYAMQFSCPTQLPSQGVFDDLYRAGVISLEPWLCYTRALDNKPNLHKMHAELNRTKIGLDDAMMLYQRELINQETYDAIVREQGVMFDVDKERLEGVFREQSPHISIDAAIRLHRLGKLTDEEYEKTIRQNGVYWHPERDKFVDAYERLPGPGDLTRYMSKDAFDETAVTENDLDNGFADKFSDRAKELANAIGVSEETMKLDWRSHWQNASPHMIFEMLHRLRPGEVDPEIAVGEPKARELLQLADWPSYLVDRMMAVSYSTITRVDARNAYEQDIIDRDGLVARLKDAGYNAADTEMLARLFDKEKDDYQRSEAGKRSVWTVRSVLDAVTSGEVTRDEAAVLLFNLKVPNEDTIDMLDGAQWKMQAITRRKCIAGIRHRFMLGDVATEDAPTLLQNLGLDDVTASTFTEQWQCERNSRAKQTSVGKLIEWFSRGIILMNDLERRLDNLGYNAADLAAYLAEAVEKQMERRQALIEKAIRKAEAEERRREKLRKQQEARAKAVLAAQQAAQSSSGS